MSEKSHPPGGARPVTPASPLAVADASFTNAISNAPVDEGGRRLRQGLPRSPPVHLAAGHGLDVVLASDHLRLGISASDPSGSCAFESVRQALVRCLRRGTDRVEQKPGGAGLGLSNVLLSCVERHLQGPQLDALVSDRPAPCLDA
jgi:hypothetical protein